MAFHEGAVRWVDSSHEVDTQRPADLPATGGTGHGPRPHRRGLSPASLVPIPPRTRRPALIVHLFPHRDSWWPAGVPVAFAAHLPGRWPSREARRRHITRHG